MNLPNLPPIPRPGDLAQPIIPNAQATTPGKLASTLGLGKLYPTEPDPTYTLVNQGYALGADAGVLRGLLVGAVVGGLAVHYLFRS